MAGTKPHWQAKLRRLTHTSARPGRSRALPRQSRAERRSLGNSHTHRLVGGTKPRWRTELRCITRIGSAGRSPGETHTHRRGGTKPRCITRIGSAGQSPGETHMHRLGRFETAQSRQSFGDSHTHRLGRIETARSRQSFGDSHTHRLGRIETARSRQSFGDEHHHRLGGMKPRCRASALMISTTYALPGSGVTLSGRGPDDFKHVGLAGVTG